MQDKLYIIKNLTFNDYFVSYIHNEFNWNTNIDEAFKFKKKTDAEQIKVYLASQLDEGYEFKIIEIDSF